MFFLLRAAFWLSVALVLLPSGQSTSKGPGPVEAVSAAGAALSDVTHFCERQADACVVGAQAAVVFGQRAQAGAKMVYEFLNEKVAATEGAKSAPAETGSVKSPPVKAAGQAAGKTSQHTLTPLDLKPAWRAPAPSKDAERAERKRPA